jgi:hypothetical protein
MPKTCRFCRGNLGPIACEGPGCDGLIPDACDLCDSGEFCDECSNQKCWICASETPTHLLECTLCEEGIVAKVCLECYNVEQPPGLLYNRCIQCRECEYCEEQATTGCKCSKEYCDTYIFACVKCYPHINKKTVLCEYHM